jgi:hypothetical protein
MRSHLGNRHQPPEQRFFLTLHLFKDGKPLRTFENINYWSIGDLDDYLQFHQDLTDGYDVWGEGCDFETLDDGCFEASLESIEENYGITHTIEPNVEGYQQACKEFAEWKEEVDAYKQQLFQRHEVEDHPQRDKFFELAMAITDDGEWIDYNKEIEDDIYNNLQRNFRVIVRTLTGKTKENWIEIQDPEYTRR